MIKVAFFVLVAILCIWPLFRALTLYSKRRNRLTAAQVADAIERHLLGTEGLWDWDHFTSIPIKDDRLDAIRLQCVELDYERPESRLQELQKIIDDLRRPDPVAQPSRL